MARKRTQSKNTTIKIAQVVNDSYCHTLNYMGARVKTENDLVILHTCYQLHCSNKALELRL